MAAAAAAAAASSVPAPTDAEAGLGPGGGSAPATAALSLSSEDARFFHDLTNEAGKGKPPCSARMQAAQALQQRIAAAAAKDTSSNKGANNASSLSSPADPTLARLLAAFTPAVLRRLVVRLNECGAHVEECCVTAHTLHALLGAQGLAPRLMEAGLLPVCLRVLRRGGIGQAESRIRVMTLVSAEEDGSKTLCPGLPCIAVHAG